MAISVPTEAPFKATSERDMHTRRREQQANTEHFGFNLYFQSQAISFLFVTKVLNKHGQKREADICKRCAFSRRLHNSITNTPVHRHQADNSQESPLHHKCTTFLFHIKMINTQKARPSADVTHSDTPRSFCSGQTGARPSWEGGAA